MNLLGVNIPPLAVAIGSMIGAFIVGIGMGLGSEIAKYYVQKHLTKKLDRIAKHTNKLLKRIYARNHK